jgi:hypothetical protein
MSKLKGRLPDFVPVFRETMNCPAWKALSFGARALYIAIKARKAPKKNCAYLSYRNALKDLGRRSHKKIAEWFSELQHYGFIVLEKHGSLGVDGKGKSPLWRIAELPNEFTGELATKEFLKWDGVLYDPKARLPCPYPRKNKRRLTVVKTSMRPTQGTPQASHMRPTQGTLPDPTVPPLGTPLSPRREQSAPPWGTGFCFSGVDDCPPVGSTAGVDEYELANRLLAALRADKR